jgi:capsular exopolysaccharide synthesis family protein
MAEQGTELREYLSILWARKWWALAVLGLVVASAIFYTVQQTPTYEASAQVLDQPVSFFAGAPPSSNEFVDMYTEQQIASSQTVARRAVRNVREQGLTPGTVSVSVPSSTSTILFTSTSPSPRAAQVTAQAYAEGYLGYRLAQAQQEQRAITKPIEDRLASVNQQLAKIQTKLSGQLSTQGRGELNLLQNDLLSERSSIQERLNNLVPADQLRVGQILQPAFLPTAPSSPDVRKNLALAVLAGLFLGLGAAAIRDRTDQRIHDRFYLERELGAPVLAMVPRIRTRQDATRRELVMLSTPNSLAAEAHKQLRTSLLVASAERGLKTILVTSPGAEEGKTATVANLGVALAHAGKRTVLISADLRRPTLHLYFGARARPGLAEVLTGQASVREALHPAHVASNLYLLSCRQVSGSSELLGSDTMKRILWKLQEEADFVIIDSAPILGLSDALTLVPVADSVLLVVRAGVTTRSALQEARHQLRQVDARVFGAVLTSVDPSSHPYGSRHYYYSDLGPVEQLPAPAPPVSRQGELHTLPAEP